MRKTPLAINFAVDKGYALATNESFDAFSGFDDDLLLFVAADEEFPEIPSDIDVVFDLAGTMSKMTTQRSQLYSRAML